MEKELRPSDTVKLIFASMAGITLTVLIAGVFISSEPLKFALGLLYGAAVSVVRILMLSRAVSVSVQMEPAEAKAYAMGQYNARMMLLVGAAVAGYFIKALSIYGIALGLIAMQPSVYIANFIYEKLGGKKFESVNAKKADRHS